jgi:hypothetical protein
VPDPAPPSDAAFALLVLALLALWLALRVTTIRAHAAAGGESRLPRTPEWLRRVAGRAQAPWLAWGLFAALAAAAALLWRA